MKLNFCKGREIKVIIPETKFVKAAALFIQEDCMYVSPQKLKMLSSRGCGLVIVLGDPNEQNL